MKDFNNTEHHPIPEGLEFNESYMQDAFAMYDAEKQKRRRRLLIWWITSATGFAALLLTGIYFLANGSHSNNSDKQLFAEKRGAPKTTSDAKISSSISTKRIITGKQFSARNNGKTSSITDKKTGKYFAKNKTANVSNHFGAEENANTKILLIRPSENKKNKDEEAILNNPKFLAPYTEIEKQERDSVFEIDLTALPLKPARLAFIENTPIDSINIQNNPHQPNTDLRKHQVYINLGVNTLFGMKELQNRVTFRECMGVSYNYQINPKWSIGAGLEYHSISRISYKRKVGDTTNSDNTTTILNKTTLNYISFLPQMSYKLGEKHRLTAGFGIEYLLVDPGERYEIMNFTSESNSRTNSKLYYSTFNRFNFSASLGYSYQFSRFMSVHALYHFGFTDITKNNSFNDTFDRNSRLQLMVKIKLY